MRRLVLLIPVIAALAAAGSAPAARSLTARFVLRITVKAPSGTLALAGSGVADAQKRVAVFTFGANGRSLRSIIHAGTDHLTVFTPGAAVQLRPGYLWARDDGSAAAPLVDPGLALRLRSSIGRSVASGFRTPHCSRRRHRRAFLRQAFRRRSGSTAPVMCAASTQWSRSAAEPRRSTRPSRRPVRSFISSSRR